MPGITLTPAWAILDSDPASVKKVFDDLSYQDKGAEHDLARFIRGEKFKYRDEDPPAWYGAWYKDTVAKLKAAQTVHACVESDGSLMVPIGLLNRIYGAVPTGSLVEDLRDFDVNRRHLGQGQSPTLRKPQQDALNALSGYNYSGLVKIATGVGKTTLGQQIIEDVGARAIFLVPTTRILKQTVRRFNQRFGKRLVGEFSGDKKQDCWVTVATYQSVYAAEDGAFDDVSVMIADEVHHVAARTFYDVAMNKLRNAVHRVGLTADSERADGGTLLVHAAVGEKVYDYSAKQGIEDGYLARPTHFVYNVRRTSGTYKKWKLNKRTKKREEVGTGYAEPYDGEDEGIAYKNWVLGNDELNGWVAAMASALMTDGKSVFILVDEIEHGEKLTAMIPGSRFVQGGGKDVDEIIDDFNDRTLKCLVGTSVVGEGADLVPVDWMFQLQGGASRSRARQADGRALRNDPDPVTFLSRKPETNIVDFRYPVSEVLDRHAGFRMEVHQETGEVHELEM